MKNFAALLLVLIFATTALATDNHEYGSDEYDTVCHGASPIGKYAITAHGSKDDYGYGSFHLFLTDAATGKPIATLKEIVGTLDTGAGAFVCSWSSNSSRFQIVYRISRHEPLKVISYEITRGLPQSMKGVVDADDKQSNYWSKSVNAPRSPEKVYGTPLKDSEKTIGTY